MKIAVALLLVFSSAASSQVLYPATPQKGVEDYTSTTAEALHGGDGSAFQECLIEKKSGRQVCHLRSEWERIAAQLARRNAKHSAGPFQTPDLRKPAGQSEP